MNSVSTQFGKQLVRGLMLAGAMLVAPFSSADDFRIQFSAKYNFGHTWGGN